MAVGSGQRDDHKPAGGYDRTVQHFDDTPDDTRPRNPWPRLLALGAVLLVMFVGAGACLVAFVNTGAEPELRLLTEQLEPGVPRFEPVTHWGADEDQFTFGAWIVQIPGEGTRAYLSREVNTGCHLQWRPTTQVNGTTGIFRDGCGGSAYAIDGAPLDGATTRHLDEFAVEVGAGEVVVDVRVVRIGACRDGVASGEVICVTSGATTRTMPRSRAIPEGFARE